MSRIAERIGSELKAGRKVLSVFLTAGFPQKFNFIELALAVLESGADLIEIGIPFSDPIADGPVIQKSSQAALQNGMTLEKCLRITEEIKKHTEKPLILMGYANPILNFGVLEFNHAAKEAGLDGVIIPDVSFEEYNDFYSEDFDGLDKILLVSPTSSDERISQISNLSQGFVYCVSVKGITGEQNKSLKNSIEYVQKVKSYNPFNPVLVGFGISNPENAKLFTKVSDGVIVGSAVITSLFEANNNYNNTLELVRDLKNSISNL